MKALTLHQPWASLIATGVKTIETRSWPPPPSVIGHRIAIPAGRKVVRDVICETWYAIAEFHGRTWWDRVPTGAVICTVRLAPAHQVEVFHGETAEIGPYPFRQIQTDPHGDFRVGRWLWFLEDLELIQPIHIKGKQRLWEVDIG